MLSGTVASKALIAVFNVLIISIAGRELGIEAVGEISLIVLGITLIMLVNNFVGGGAVTYLVGRFPIRALLVPAYLWAILTAGLGFLVVSSLDLVPAGFEKHVVILAFIESLFTVHLGILLGKERLAVYNSISALQVLVLCGTFYGLILSGSKDVFQYVIASYVAFSCSLVLSTFYIARLKETNAAAERKEVFQAMFRQGGYIQLANIFQLLSYRFNYYLIERFLGLASLGNFAIGTQLSEGSWLVPKSIGTVVYMKVSAEQEREKQARLSIAFMHLAMLSSALVVLVLLLLPNVLYEAVFGSEIGALARIILPLSPGIIAMAGAQSLSHFFSGIGANHQNTISSGIGMLITICLGFVLIPRLELEGACWVASVAYTALFVYQLFAFSRISGASPMQLMPNREALREIVKLLSAK